MRRLHSFMDKMREKPIGERRRILFSSMIISGAIISLVGVYNILDNLAAAGAGSGQPPSIWAAIKGELQNLNDKL